MYRIGPWASGITAAQLGWVDTAQRQSAVPRVGTNTYPVWIARVFTDQQCAHDDSRQAKQQLQCGCAC